MTAAPEAVQIRGLGAVAVRKLDEIQPAPSNPRKIPGRAVEVVAESLKRFGWQQPIVVDSDGMVIVGHTRLQAAKLLGLESAPVLVASNLTPAEVQAYRIADNRTHDFSSWDLSELVGQLEVLDDDFAKVLNLQDWKTLVDDFEELQIDVPDDVQSNARSGFVISIVFGTKDEALAQEQMLMELPGVLNVRHARP